MEDNVMIHRQDIVGLLDKEGLLDTRVVGVGHSMREMLRRHSIPDILPSGDPVVSFFREGSGRSSTSLGS